MKLSLPIAFSLLLVNSCSDSARELAELLESKRIEWTQENSIVCYGNSLTAGVVNADSSYPAFLSEKLRINVVNKGMSGATTRDGLDRIETIFASKPVLVLLEFGANDFLLGDSVSQASDNIIEMINKITNYGAEVALLSFVHPDMVDCVYQNRLITEHLSSDTIQVLIDFGLKYHEMLDSVAAEYDLPYEDYLYEGIACDSTMLTWDGIHPNGRGNMRMADNVFEEFHNIFDLSGMISN